MKITKEEAISQAFEQGGLMHTMEICNAARTILREQSHNWMGISIAKLYKEVHRLMDAGLVEEVPCSAGTSAYRWKREPVP